MTVKYKKYLTPFCIACMIGCNSLSLVLNKYIPLSAFFSIIGPFIIILINERIKLYKQLNCFIIFVLLFLILGSLSCEETSLYSLLCFFTFGIPFLVVASIKFDIEILLKCLVILGLFLVPINILHLNLNLNQDDIDWENTMANSYNIIKFTIPAIILLFFKVKLLYKILSIIVIVISSIFLIPFGTRGALVAILISVLLCLIYINNKPINLYSYKIYMVLGIIWAGSFFFFDIVKSLDTYLKSKSINSTSIFKILQSEGNSEKMVSGRYPLFDKAINGFYDSPIWGQGIGSFDNYSGNYPHNVFLQLLYEGGIIFFIPFAFIIIGLFIYLNKKQVSRIDRYFLIFLISAGLIQLLFSYTYWMAPVFWLSIGYVLNHYFHNKKEMGTYSKLKTKLL